MRRSHTLGSDILETEMLSRNNSGIFGIGMLGSHILNESGMLGSDIWEWYARE